MPAKQNSYAVIRDWAPIISWLGFRDANPSGHCADARSAEPQNRPSSQAVPPSQRRTHDLPGHCQSTSSESAKALFRSPMPMGTLLMTSQSLSRLSPRRIPVEARQCARIAFSSFGSVVSSKCVVWSSAWHGLVVAVRPEEEIPFLRDSSDYPGPPFVEIQNGDLAGTSISPAESSISGTL